jgi:hypothetical protein
MIKERSFHNSREESWILFEMTLSLLGNTAFKNHHKFFNLKYVDAGGAD